MSLDRIVCLANSYKHDHRCIAGISLTTKKWVRLVGRRIPGCLTIRQTCYRDGSEAAILDVFDAALGETCGSNPHPEDVFVTEDPWRLVRRFDELRDAQFLNNYVNRSPVLLQGYGDRIYIREFADAPATHSLELIQPDDLWWWVRESGSKRKNRALFRLGKVNRAHYNLAVTDPAWLDELHLLPAGIYPHAFFFGGKPPKALLTVSLSEPFENFHYKLVAGVVNLPA
jgi:hypothetical protein